MSTPHQHSKMLEYEATEINANLRGGLIGPCKRGRDIISTPHQQSNIVQNESIRNKSPKKNRNKG